MRLLHIITSLRTGGAERLMTTLLPRLQGMGHEAELLLFDGSRTPYYEELERAAIPIHSLSIGQRAMHDPLLGLRLRAFLRSHSFDILHTHNTPCQLLTALTASGPTLFTTEHNTTNRRRKWQWYRGIDRWMYGKYRRVICVSRQVEENLAIQLASPRLRGRITTVPNGIDLGAYRAAQPDKALQRQWQGRRILIMVAAFRYQKDHQTLLRALAALPDDYILLLAGDGECRPQCELLARQLGVADRVSFLGFRTDVPSLLATADLMVMSSHWEGCPLSAIEAMAAGLPVVASDVQGLSETIGEAGVLFPHGDHKALASACQRILEDGGLRASLAARGREYASQFGIGRMASEYERLYQEAILPK